MTTIYTPLGIFNTPGPLRTLLEKRGFTPEWVTAPGAPKGAGWNEASLQALHDRAPEMEFMIANTSPLDGDFFSAAKRLRLVAMFGVGLDHIDIAAATAAGALVTNVPGGNARCVAELAFSLMLDLSHKVTQMHTDLVKGSWRPRLGFEISGKTLGLIGFGSIGQDMARIAKAFGMRVIFANRTARPEPAAQLGAEQLPFEQVLAEADYVSVHIPGGGEWHFGKREFSMMQKGAYFINTARGEIADLDALADALAGKHLAGAGLDVFPHEPLDQGHPILAFPNVVATPHAGGLSAESMARVTESCLDEVTRILNGQRSPNARNPEVYDGREGF